MIKVTCGIIERGGKVLVTQRSERMHPPLKWEFPGGKVDNGESYQECLLREIKEELNISVKIKKELTPNIHSYKEKKIELIPFVCEYSSGEIVLLEHSDYKWLNPSQLKGLDWAEADKPILDEYLSTIDKN